MLSYEEFLRMPREEQNRRIYELSNHDRFRARMQDSEIGTVVVERSASPEDIEKNRKFMEVIENGEINVLDGKK